MPTTPPFCGSYKPLVPRNGSVHGLSLRCCLPRASRNVSALLRVQNECPVRSGGSVKRVEDLVQMICGAPDHPLAAVLRGWGLASRPVLAFMEAHATKLRKKVRLARSVDEQADLLAELAIGRLLAQDRRIQVQYEPQPAAAGHRGPDFQATFKGHTRVYVEVTRLRLRPEDPAGAALKLARVLCDKVSQCVPGETNVLAVVLPPEVQSGALVPTAVQMLHTPPDTPGAATPWTPDRLFTYRRLQGRLSGVLLCSLTPEGDCQPVTLWSNPQARRPLLPEIAGVLTLHAVGRQGPAHTVETGETHETGRGDAQD